MGTSEERARVLRLVEEGRITAEEGVRLLAALGGGDERPRRGGARATARARAARAHAHGRRGGARVVRLRVTDAASGKRRLDVTMPPGVVDFLLRAGRGLGVLDDELAGLDLALLEEALGAEGPGRVLDWFDDESGHRVEIYVQ